jgi:hypothetical protein
MIAENREAVSGRPIMLQVNGIDHLYGPDERHPNHKGDRCGRAYNMSEPVRSKKMAVKRPPKPVCGNWT